MNIKSILLLILTATLAACGGGSGGGGGSEETTTTVNTAAQQLLGDWFLPAGCDQGPDTAMISLAESTAQGKFIITYSYWDNDNYYNQFLSDVDISVSSESNGVTVYSYTASTSGTTGQQDLPTQGQVRMNDGRVQLDSVCNTAGIALASPFITDKTTIADEAKAYHLLESLLIRDYYLAIFNNDWLPIHSDLARRGLHGGSVDCDSRKSLAEDYLQSLTQDLDAADNKFDMFNLPTEWANDTYQFMLTEDITDLAHTRCDLTSLVNTYYASLII